MLCQLSYTPMILVPCEEIESPTTDYETVVIPLN